VTERPGKKQLRTINEPFVAAGPSGVAIRGRLKNLAPGDEEVLRAAGAHLGRLASSDLRRRCADGNDHGSDTWAVRKQGLTAGSRPVARIVCTVRGGRAGSLASPGTGSGLGGPMPAATLWSSRGGAVRRLRAGLSGVVSGRPDGPLLPDVPAGAGVVRAGQVFR
jgi:hypothetical protein